MHTDPEGYIEEVLSKQALFLAMQNIARLLLPLPQLVSNMFLTSNRLAKMFVYLLFIQYLNVLDLMKENYK